MSTFDEKLDKVLDFEAITPSSENYKVLRAIVSLFRRKLNEGLVEPVHELHGPLIVEIEPGAFPFKVVIRVPAKQYHRVLFRIELGPPLKFDGEECTDLAEAVLDYCYKNRNFLYSIREYANRL